MIKNLIISGVLLFALVGPVLASKPNENHGNKERKNEDRKEKSEIRKEEKEDNDESDDEKQERPAVVTIIIPNVSGGVFPSIACDPDFEWKNHGQFVSCVARVHEGGDDVSEAARSRVGRVKRDVSPTISVTPTIILSPTITGVPTVSPALSLTPLPTVSATDSSQSNPVIGPFINIQLFFQKIKDLILIFRFP